ncbi:hypothetical protein E1B28_012188 [Marasmius oreades]|uniref:Exoribonuclease phosphorolytic domain-containing protein n=1 Tax=Marasmius oreades TaxID=181124 RepID=A0A9P7RR57_9AGAR|nr:uncharacterized protein E1B28_012188 [Marasmius oreades]KAG7088167.1 hypothetical protein E1B28_012188 [Marasmius oreades]
MTTRAGGRSSTSLREVFLSFDTLSRVDGSARFGFGSVPQALVSLSGPIEVRLAAEHPSQATLEVHLRPISNVPSTESKFLSSSISSALTPSLILTQNPRTLIQIVIQTLVSSPGSKWKDGLVASMINACTLALINAGSIPMRGVVCAVSLGCIRVDSTYVYVVDPTEDEARDLVGGGCFAFLFSDFEPLSESGATCVWSSWRRWDGFGFDEEEILKARGMAKEAAREVWRRVKRLVEETEDTRMTSAIPIPKNKAAKMKMNEGEVEDAKMEI